MVEEHTRPVAVRCQTVSDKSTTRLRPPKFTPTTPTTITTTKVLTHQWIPANNTFIYNGIGGTAQTMEF